MGNWAKESKTDTRAKSVVGQEQRKNKRRQKGKGRLIKSAEERISV